MCYINPSDITKKLGISALTDLLELHLCEVVNKLKTLKKVELASIFCLILNCHQTMASENLDLLEENRALKADNEILTNELISAQHEKEELKQLLAMENLRFMCYNAPHRRRTSMPSKVHIHHRFNPLTGEYEVVRDGDEPVQKAAGQ